LPAGIAHLKGKFDKVKNRDFGKGAGPLDEVGCTDHPAKAGDTKVFFIFTFTTILFHSFKYKMICLETK
jgi:hypothetical protein